MRYKKHLKKLYPGKAILLSMLVLGLLASSGGMRVLAEPDNTAGILKPTIPIDAHFDGEWQLFQPGEQAEIEVEQGGRVALRAYYFTAEHDIPNTNLYDHVTGRGEHYVPPTGDIAQYAAADDLPNNIFKDDLIGVLSSGHKVEFQWYIAETAINDPQASDVEKLMYGPIPQPGSGDLHLYPTIGNEYEPDTSADFLGTANYYFVELIHTDPDGTVHKYYSSPVKVTVNPLESYPEELMTPAEASGWRMASGSEDIFTYCQKLETVSNGRIRMEVMGQTLGLAQAPENATHPYANIYRPSDPQDVFALIMGDPPPVSAADVPEDKAVAFIIGNIHSGELEGKEAMLILAREIALGMHDDLLEDLVIVFIPNLNADGNKLLLSQYDNDRRYLPKLAGTRITGGVINPSIAPNVYNPFNEGHNWYNINRDMTKLDSPEARILVKIMTDWDPVLFMDLHSGMVHYNNSTTWNWGLHPDTDPAIMDYNRDDFFNISLGPDSYMYKEKGKTAQPYSGGVSGGLLDGGSGRWNSFEDYPRYTTNYIGLRNRLAILIETRANDPYTVRVDTQIGCIYGSLLAVQQDKDKIKGLIAEADSYARNRVINGIDPAKDTVTLSSDIKWLRDIELETFLEVNPGTGNYNNAQFFDIRDTYNTPGETDKSDRAGKLYAGLAKYTVPYICDWYPTGETPMGAYYLLDHDCDAAAEMMDLHGIEYARLTKPVTVQASDFQWFNATQRRTTATYYDGRFRSNSGGVQATWVGSWKNAEAEQAFPAGTIVVSTAQPLGALAALLLEPEAEDGLMNWNYAPLVAAQNPGIKNFFDNRVDNKSGTVRANYKSDATGDYYIPIFKVTNYASIQSSVSGVWANPESLSSAGGSITVNIQGNNLKPGILVIAYDDKENAINSAYSDGTDGSLQQAVLALPANNTDSNKVYIIRYSPDNGNTWIFGTEATVSRYGNITDVTVGVEQLVAGCAANVPVIIEGNNLGKVNVKIVSKDGQAVYGETDITDAGRAVVRIDAAKNIAAGTYDVIVTADASTKTAELKVVPYNADIWVVQIDKSVEGKTNFLFAADISTLKGYKVVINGETTFIPTQDRNSLVIDYAAKTGDVFVVSGVKYAKLFPSYSFTFTVI